MNTAIPATLGAFGQALDGAGVPTSFDAPADLSYRPQAPAAPPPATPLQNIRRKLLAAQIARQEGTRTANLYTSLPMIAQDIERANADKAAAFEVIERTRQQIMAPPPEAPTHPEATWQETAAGLAAALFSGGGAGATRAVGDTLAVAQARQSNEFANKFRLYRSQQDAARMQHDDARQDEARAQSRGDLFTREYRDTLQHQQDARAKADADAAERQDRWNLETYKIGAEDDQRRAKFADDVSLKKYEAALNAARDDARRRGDHEAEAQASQRLQLWGVARNSPDPMAVEGALDQLAQLGERQTGKMRAGLVSDAKRRADIAERTTAAREASAANGGASGAVPYGVQLQAAKLQQEGFQVPAGLTGGFSPLPTAGGSGAPLQVNVPQGAFLLTEKAQAARGALASRLAEHRALLSQDPGGADLSNPLAIAFDPKAAAEKDKVRKEWQKKVDASAVQLAGARRKYWDSLLPAKRDEMKAAAKTYFQAIQDATAAKRKTTDQRALDALNNRQRAARDEFEETYGLDIDTVLKGAK